MAGETQRMHAVKELGAESKLQDERTAVQQQSVKTTKESSEHFSSADTDARTSSRGPKLDKVKKERSGTQQREAVIRPQQAGKIDFRSLQNRSKFAVDRTWSSGKGSPQSPSGKGRGRDKSKRSGKSERGNPQHLYSLSITNTRSNLNIGIAYPQQKVSPATKLDTGRGPVSGSYRLYTPSIPEREVEIQQEELNYNRCFQEASSNLTSSSFTSQALGSSSGTPSHQHLPLSQKQQPATMENNSAQSGGQLILTDFQLSASNAWQSPDKTFNGANYASSQKSTAHTDKTNALVPGSFQYGYHFLEESTSDSFPCEQNPQPQDFTDSSLGSVHGTHNSFSFLPADGPNLAQNSTKFSNEQQPEPRSSSYPHAQQPQFIQGVAASIQYPRNLSEDSTSSDSSASISQQPEQGKNALTESTDGLGQVDSKDAAIAPGSTRNCHLKDTTVNQRTQASVHHTRTIPHTQMHFLSKTMNSSTVNRVHTSSVQFDKNGNNNVLNGLPHSWEGPNKTFLPVEQNSVQYSDVTDKFQFQSAPDKRLHVSKDNRMQWQQLRPADELSFQSKISNQKMSYMVSPSEWQDDNKSHKNSSLKIPSSFQSSRNSESFSNQRQEAVKQVSAFKVEMSHAQLCESKNKALYFGLNQTIPVSSSRNYNFSPLQVAPMGLMMVSPYESPLPSPAHTPASSSTCSSLSPASTSPVNSTSEDSQMSKSGGPVPFYHQPQSKIQLASDHLNAHSHQFHAEGQRNIPYAPDRDKDNMMGYLHSNTHVKTTMDGSKGYMDSYGMEHHQPPPPYSAHQLFATSLTTANLDQLDVLLTCKQCDQNFSNVASFLGHKQYCTQPNMPKIEDNRKFHTEPPKAVSSPPNVSMPRCPSDLHLSLLGLNKNGELISDNETKVDSKDDPMKLNLFSGSGNLPVPLPELEMEDAKLDSLITEALNGLGYQSDNAEIDSSFIDAFADDDLHTVKATSNKQCVKTKESVVVENKDKQAALDSSSSRQDNSFYDSDVDNPKRNKTYSDKLAKTPLNFECNQKKNNTKKETSPKNPKTASREKMKEHEIKVKEARKLCKSDDESASTPRFLLSSTFSERCAFKSSQDKSALGASMPIQASTSPTSRTAVKESKRRSTGGGTWSKELIHKIVQQKNKLNVKGSKNLQFSLVMERLTPTVQNPAFGEYDYVSDSDDECEPVKIASQGRLNQSSRCKYTYTKECKWRARSERDRAAWRHDSKECFEVKKSEEISLSPEKHGSPQRLKRRGSRSSTSSDLSTSVSVSSDSINSPKSIDRIESVCDIKKKESPEQKSNESSSCNEASRLALTFTKSLKRCNADKANLFHKKDSTENSTNSIPHAEIVDPMPSLTAFEKITNGDLKSRELMSNSKENIPTVSLCTNTLESTDNLCPKEEQIQCGSAADNKLLPFISHSATSNKETDSNVDKSKKGKRKPRPSSTQAEESGFTLPFEKQPKEAKAIALVNELDMHKPATLCTSLIDEVCLSPTQSQGPLIQKDTLHLMPYTLDQDQGLMKSPLTFDTSSMFGDLAAFDSGLYSDMPIQKDGFHSLESTVDKKEEFVPPFSSFLEQRDWNLIVSPELPDEISHYKGNFDKSNEKKTDYNDVALSLPEKIIDYSANLSSCVSEDELEIKRIVNELENQLQTTKLETPLSQEHPKQLQMSKFSPLRLSEESENDTIDAPVASEPFHEPELPWTSPFHFDLVSGHHSPHSVTVALENYAKKEGDTSNGIMINSQLYNDHKPEERNLKKDIDVERKEDILEQNQYTENLMKSIEVMSDSLFKSEPIISEHREPNATSLTSPQQESECHSAQGEDHSEKVAITKKQDIFSPSNNKEQKDNIEFLLKESQSALPRSADHIVCANQQISSEPSEPTKNSVSKAEMELISDGRVPEMNTLIESSHHSSAVDSHADEDTNADKNVNPLLQNCDVPPHLTDSYQEADALVPSSATLLHSSVDIHKSPVDGMPNGDELKCGHAESTIENRHCLVDIHNVSPNPDLLVDIITTNKPCSPILVESNAECTQNGLTFQDIQSLGQSSLLVLSQMESLNNADATSYPCKAPQLDDSLKNEPNLSFNVLQRKEDLLDVHDIREGLPVDFMASHVNSPCREGAEGDQCNFLHTSSPVSPILAQQKEMDIQEDTRQSQCSDAGDPSPIQRTRLPDAKPKCQNEATDCDVAMKTTVDMDSSLTSPPHLELPNADINIHFPASVPSTVEQSENFDNRDPSRNDFKLSHLNYKNNSDEPPQLTQYDYIPISPASNLDGNPYIKSGHSDAHEQCFTPKLIVNKPPTDSPLALNPVEANKTSSLNEPLAAQNMCVGLSAEIQSTNSSAGNVNENVENVPEPCESIKLPLRNFESSSGTAERSLLPIQDISGCLLTAKPLILCENEPSLEPGQSLKKETSPKKIPNNLQQGKVLCEICFLCFRTVPGLKRHKAMKHAARSKKPVGPPSTTSGNQRMSLIYEASHSGEKEHKDDSQPSPTQIDEMTETGTTLILKASATEEMAVKASAVAKDEMGNQNSLLPTKTKKNSKARKNKTSEENSKLDPFSDELLNILKTDLLQAITPEFKSNVQEQPDRHGTGTEETLCSLTSNSVSENASQSPTEETNVLSESGAFNRVTDSDKILCTDLSEEVKGQVEENMNTKHPASSKSLDEQSDEKLAQEILGKVAVEVKCELNDVSSDKLHPLACLTPPPPLTPPGISPDLKALLDDDTIFSQLFPRDEEAKRKKCPRVYGKRNKRQKLSSDSDVAQDCAPPSETQNTTSHLDSQTDKTHTDNQTTPCEYETISLDDTIMLKMCHNSALKVPDVKTVSEDKPNDQEEEQNNLLNPFQSTVDQPSVEWSSSQDSTATAEPIVSKAEASNPACPLPPRVTESAQKLHIDIQNINTTFQLPEIQFFDSSKDVPVTPPTAPGDMENKDDEKSKKLLERRGRKRQEGGIKVKDKQYKCKVCFTWFLTLGELNFHKLSHNPSPPPTCYMCVQRKFSSREQLRDHLWEKHAKNKSGIWTCGMCLKEISDVWMYNEHLREHATQFARRGQTQGSMLTIPGCFMQETAVKNFITSIMQHRPSKANRESSKTTKEQEKTVAANLEAGKTQEGAERKLHKSRGSGNKNTLTPLEVLHKTEAPKNVEMHPNCKDPSRDCHHCGKRFPKPFKLQRHLVVHNLEKIFLCHKCPVSYQDAQDLKEHLKMAHKEADEPDSKHTTLYTCELCADVMHVIKKSFICSTCNYTFSKKEQFDRHMEKHLSGGNKIFKFRGVHRPVKASPCKDDECDSPASKKRRILSDSLQENSTDSGIASVSSLHLNQGPETQTPKANVPMLDDSTQTTTDDTNSTNVKTEDIAQDYSDLLVELEKCISMGSSTAAPKEEQNDATLAANLDQEGNGESTSEPCDVKEENESVCIRVETPEWSASQERDSEREETTKVNDISSYGDTESSDSLPPSKDSFVSLREPQVTAKTPETRQAADAMAENSTQKAASKQQGSLNGAEQKDKVRTSENAKPSMKATESTQVLQSKASTTLSASHEEKEPQRAPKKRKEVKSTNSLSRVSFPATQENFGVDPKAKKKYHPSKCLNPSTQRKFDGPNDYPVLASVRDDVVSNKIISKCKTSTLGLQLKRSLLDSCAPKKADIAVPLNGDYKSKKGTVGRPLHTSISKVSSVPMNNSLNKSRPKQGVRSVESHSYRTAESQNHLLSQLFGQKLTSFKIPLRKDASESIN
ncbi:zinc finger protein 469 [Vanacampus margaritifer]